MTYRRYTAQRRARPNRRRRYVPRRRTPPRRRRVTHRRMRPNRRSVLNISSIKKRDTLMPVTNITSATPAGSSTYTTGSATLNGNVFYIMPFMPTRRYLQDPTSHLGSLSARTASNTFARGYSETVKVVTNDGMPWSWRRIVFNLKGRRLTSVESLATGATQQWSRFVAGKGYERVINNIYSGQDFQQLMFRGDRDVDWYDEMTAPIDTTNIKLLSDKTTRIAGGNEEGVQIIRKLWYPFNKTLLYRDDELAEGITGNTDMSVESRVGMGDVYIVDMFLARAGATSTSQLLFAAEGTYYWHER